MSSAHLEVIPAVDLRGGRCVRLRQGRLDDETVFSDDPVAMARRWQALGARRLHVVDLDGAVGGAPANAPLIRAICAALSIPVQLGGGRRDLAGAAVACPLWSWESRGSFLGTLAVRQPDNGP